MSNQAENNDAWAIASTFIGREYQPTPEEIYRACNDDTELTAAVEEFIKNYFEGQKFIDDWGRLFDSEDSAMARPGGMVGSYKLQECISVGGFARIWRAADEEGNLFAIKIPQNRQAIVTVANEEQVLRRLHEVDGVVKLIDVVSYQDGEALVLEFLSGDTLAEVLANDRAPSEEIRELIGQLLLILEGVHSFTTHDDDRPIAHGDVTPRNIMLSPEGRLKLIDFGSGFRTISSEALNDTTRSIAPRPLGFAPDYRVPEVMLGTRSGIASDLYQVGLLAFEMLCGKNYTRLIQSQTAEAAEEHLAQVHPSFAHTILKALQWDPKNRFKSAADMRRAWLADKPHRPTKRVTRRTQIVSVVVMGLLVAAVSTVVGLRSRSAELGVTGRKKLQGTPLVKAEPEEGDLLIQWSGDPAVDFRQVSVNVQALLETSFDKLSPRRYETHPDLLNRATNLFSAWQEEYAEDPSVSESTRSHASDLGEFLDASQEVHPLHLYFTNAEYSGSEPLNATVFVNGESVSEIEFQFADGRISPAKIELPVLVTDTVTVKFNTRATYMHGELVPTSFLAASMPFGGCRALFFFKEGRGEIDGYWSFADLPRPPYWFRMAGRDEKRSYSTNDYAWIVEPACWTWLFEVKPTYSPTTRHCRDTLSNRIDFWLSKYGEQKAAHSSKLRQKKVRRQIEDCRQLQRFVEATKATETSLTLELDDSTAMVPNLRLLDSEDELLRSWTASELSELSELGPISLELTADASEALRLVASDNEGVVLASIPFSPLVSICEKEPALGRIEREFVHDQFRVRISYVSECREKLPEPFWRLELPNDLREKGRPPADANLGLSNRSY